MTAIPKVPIGGGSGNLTATYLLQNHTGDTGLTSAWYMIDLATTAGGPGHLYILADGTPVVDTTVYIQGYPLNPTSVTFTQSPNNLATDAAFTYDPGIQLLTASNVATGAIFDLGIGLNISSLTSDVVIYSTAGNRGIHFTAAGATLLTGIATDGFVKTSGSNGTLIIDTTSYQPAGSYLTGSLTTGRVALSVTATSVTDDAGLTYDAGTNILTATGAFLGPLFYNPAGAVTLRAGGGTLTVETTSVGSAVAIQAPDGDVTLACNTNVTGPTIQLLRTAAGGGHAVLSTRDVVASGASAVLDAWDWTAGTVTITGNTNITTATGFNLVVIRQPTYYASNVLTVDKAATLVIENAPNAGINAVITTAYSLWIQAGDVRFQNLLWQNTVGVNTGGLLTLGINGSFGSGAAVQVNTEDTYIALGGSVKTGLYVTSSYPQYSSITSDMGYFGPTIVGYGSQTFSELWVASGGANALRLGYGGDAGPGYAMAMTDVIVINGSGTTTVNDTTIALTASSAINIGGGGGDVTIDPGAHIVSICGATSTLAFFGGSPSGQATGGAATAGALYTATEQAMLQKAYDCLRTFHLLT